LFSIFGVVDAETSLDLRERVVETVELGASRAHGAALGMFDPARLVFIDETSTNAAMVRLPGRCRRRLRFGDTSAVAMLSSAREQPRSLGK
jgi:hypothetical protein